MTREEILAKYPTHTNTKTETLDEEHSVEKMTVEDLQMQHMQVQMQPYGVNNMAEDVQNSAQLH